MNNTPSKKHYTLEYKAKVILYYEYLQIDTSLPISSRSINHMERLCDVDRRTIRAWLKNRVKILEACKKRNSFQVPRDTKREICKAMEDDVNDWLVEKRLLGACISGDDLKREAILAYDRIHPVGRQELQEPMVSRCSKVRERFTASTGLALTVTKKKRGRKPGSFGAKRRLLEGIEEPERPAKRAYTRKTK